MFYKIGEKSVLHMKYPQKNVVYFSARNDAPINVEIYVDRGYISPLEGRFLNIYAREIILQINN